MKEALLAWPQLSTVRLIQLTLRLWVWAILLAVLFLIVPGRQLLEAFLGKQLPGYMSSIALLFIAVLVDRLVDRFLSKQSFWGVCEWLLQRAVNGRGLKPEEKSFKNMCHMRVRGDTAAWRNSMRLVTESMHPPPDAEPGSNDAAQRVAPWTVAGALLFGGVSLAPIWWPAMLIAFNSHVWKLTLSALGVWAVLTLVLGAIASVMVGPWIRERCR